MKTLIIVIILTLLPISCSVRADSLATMVGVGGMGYDPDLYYIESIDTTYRSIGNCETYWAVDEAGCHYPAEVCDTMRFLDTTWAEYVTGKFTKEQNDDLMRWLAWMRENDMWRIMLEPIPDTIYLGHGAAIITGHK